MMLQDIQMDTWFTDGAAEIQVLDSDGLTAATYNWYKKDSEDGKAGPAPEDGLCDRVLVPEGKNGLWFYVEYDEETGNMSFAEYQDDVEFEYGDSFQLSGRKGKVVATAGGVTDAITSFILKNTGYNYIGNPYPADIDIQEVQVDTWFTDGAAEIQMLDSDGLTAATYNWYKKDSEDGKAGPAPEDGLCDRVLVPEGKNGLWFYVEYDEETGNMSYAELAEDVTIAPSDGFQLSGRKGKYVYLTCPYEL